MNLQKYFEEFHDRIRLDSENEDLRKSRDAIKEKLTTSFKDYFKTGDIPVPTFFDQGSYAMNTGVKPPDKEGNYDIDEGVKFNIATTQYSDPVEVKKYVRDSLSRHTELGTIIKQPCVRVIYSENGDELYHVDLAIYATNGQEARGSTIYLGRGKEYSIDENKYWENVQPELLIDLVNTRFAVKEELYQFRRVIRCLKRWKDLSFSSRGNSAPRGIALTVAAMKYFVPIFGVDGKPDDIAATLQLVERILINLQYDYSRGEMVKRFVCYLPVQPGNDLFAKMTEYQMEIFLEKLEILRSKLTEAIIAPIEDDGCLLLAEVFGDEFPSADISKVFHDVRKPKLGNHPQITTIPGYDIAPSTILLKGYVKVKDKSIQIISDRRVLSSDRILEFHAEINDNIDAELSWRIINTGKHVTYLSQNASSVFNPFRGILHAAHFLRKAYGKYNNVLAPTKLVTQEHTEYTGKHWIECVAIKDGICIAKSKPFFVNIYNEKYPYYD